MSGMNDKKSPGSVDVIMDQKMNILVDIVDQRLDQVYKDFNLAMEAKNQSDLRLEARLANMVQVLFGLVNEQKIRLVTLEDYIIKHGIGTGPELEEQYLGNLQKFKEESGWEEVPVSMVTGVNPLDAATPSDEDLKPF